MKNFALFLLLFTAVFFNVNMTFAQKYAASQTFTEGNKSTYKISYFEELLPATKAESVAENLEIIWHRPEPAAIGEHAYYSKLIGKSFINWTLNNQRVAQYANTTVAEWEFPTYSGFPSAYSNKIGNLYIVADGKELYVLDPATGDEIWHKTFTEYVSFAAAYPDGTGFYCSVGEYPNPYTVYSFLTNSQTPKWSLPADNTVVGIGVAEDHSQVIVCLSQPAQKAMIVDPANGEIKQELYYYNNSPNQTPAFSANGEYLALADFSGKGTLYKRVNGKYEEQWKATLQHAGSTSTWGCGIAISADGSTIAFGTLGFIPTGFMGSLYVFNYYSNEPLWSRHDFGDEVCYISITDDGALIGAVSWGTLDNSNPDLYIFRKECSEPVATLGTPGSLGYIDLAPDGSRGVATGKATHYRVMGSGGNAYFFNPVPATYGNIAGNATLIGAEDHSFVLLTLQDMDEYYAFSNASGDFSIKYIPAGTYKLTASKQGYYSKTIENIVITGGNTTTVNIELEPAGEPVQHLFASQGAYSTVNLTWNNYESSHTGYNIYRKGNEAAPFTEVFATVGANVTEFIDDTALPTIRYYYAVTAKISADLESPFSNIALGYTSTTFITKVIDIYTAEVIPTIDGVISPGEWDDAFVFDASDFLGSDGTFQPVGSVIIYMKADEHNLYVAVENKNDTQLSTGDRTAFYIDDNFNGVYEEPGNDSEGNYWINYAPGGNYSIQYRPIYNSGGVGTVVDLTPAVAASDATGYVVAEFVLPIGPADSDITPGPGNKSKAYIYVRDGAYGNQDGHWPYDNPEFFVPIGYGTFNFFAANNVPPPPANLRYTPFFFNSPEFVAISWDNPNINNLSHFHVTIKNITTDATEVFEVFGNQMIYEVEDLTTYHVTVTTMNKSGQESVPTEVLEIVVNLVGIVTVEKTAFKIYPNPANSELHIELQVTSDELQVEIYDISGKKLSSHPLITSSTHHTINVSNFTAGIYFIRVGNGVQKFVKQ